MQPELVEVKDRAKALARMAPDPVIHYTFRSFVQLHADNPRLALLQLADPHPTVLLARTDNHLMVAISASTTEDELTAVFQGLKREYDANTKLDRLASETPHSENRGGQRTYFLDTMPLQAFAAAQRAGFQSDQQEHNNPAVVYAFTGKPRFSHVITHSCRLGRGLELLEPLKTGVHYDPEGHYVRSCLENGKSYVCELGGQAICWSTNHLNKSMGMIYTPPKQRRHGYAKSLAAFQIDDCLADQGIAIAHVMEDNIASRALLTSMGASELPGLRICWRSIFAN